MSRTEIKVMGILRKSFTPLSKHDIAEQLGHDPYSVGKALLSLKQREQVEVVKKKGHQFLYVLSRDEGC